MSFAAILSPLASEFTSREFPCSHVVFVFLGSILARLYRALGGDFAGQQFIPFARDRFKATLKVGPRRH
jgi:hypothetical protein